MLRRRGAMGGAETIFRLCAAQHDGLHKTKGIRLFIAIVGWDVEGRGTFTLSHLYTIILPTRGLLHVYPHAHG